MPSVPNTIDFQHVTLKDVPQVGGKNASLGEMITHLCDMDIAVPHGFATTAEAFRHFLSYEGMDKKIYALLKTLDINNIAALTKTGKTIRDTIMQAPFSAEFEASIAESYQALIKKIGHDTFSVAVRSSATAEDLPNASFAGQQETFLNIQGLPEILHATKAVFASLFNDRAIAYRVHHHFPHDEVAISVGIQEMVRSDCGASGVMFTLDTESGFEDVILINAAYGLGELVVQGSVNPDEFYVYKPALKKKQSSVLRRTLGSKNIQMIYQDNRDTPVKITDVSPEAQLVFCLNTEEIECLGRMALEIESHYKRPMDIEWAKDGITGKLYILQARPETVKSREHKQTLERYTLKKTGPVLAEGRSIGQRIGQGQAKIIKSLKDMDDLKPGDVLITDMTDPDWEPVMKRASAIVTNRGGRTCHAAIIARELGIPAVVGCHSATETVPHDAPVTVSCAEGDIGYIYEGLIPFQKSSSAINALPEIPVKIMMNVGNPERAFAFQSLPNEGVGLARLEFIISNTIGIHPKALIQYDTLDDAELKKTIADKIKAYASPTEYYIERLKEGIATIAAAFYPKPVIVRMSDFKSNEYANLIGGKLYEPVEENPMLGFRGASRYTSPRFADCFALECEALKRVRYGMGLDNVEIMIPFVRTVEEAKGVAVALKAQGLCRDTDKTLRLIMMCELPSNALLAEEFLPYFDGFSIGSNDLTQLTLGLDRDSSLVAAQFDERNQAVKALLHMAISACKKQNKYIGICGQGPSDHPDLAEWLMKEGIDTMSLNPDSVLETYMFLARNAKSPAESPLDGA